MRDVRNIVDEMCENFNKEKLDVTIGFDCMDATEDIVMRHMFVVATKDDKLRHDKLKFSRLVAVECAKAIERLSTHLLSFRCLYANEDIEE